MKTLEDHKDAVEVLWVDANAVVSHREDPLGTCTLSAYPHMRDLRTAKLDRVRDEVLKELQKLLFVTRDAREMNYLDLRFALFERHFQVGKSPAHNSFAVCGRQGPAPRADS